MCEGNLPTNLPELHAAAVQTLKGGKRVGDAVYLHKLLLSEQSEEIKHLIKIAVTIACIDAEDFNVVRLALRRPEMALLSYPSFFDDPFPAVMFSSLVDLQDLSTSKSDFSRQNNPTILHRKEALLPRSHPRWQEFCDLTQSLEDYGAFERPLHLIGRRSYWLESLAALGLSLRGHELVVGTRSPVTQGDKKLERSTVARHRTAISRSRLSSPMQALARWGFLDGTPTVLDYGCGRGDDIRALVAAGVSALGWDPHFLPDTVLERSDVVNLGFVLNVIESPVERATALRSAYSLTRRVLSIAVMLSGKGSGDEHGDGVLTSRKTFQRYFTQSELRMYVSSVLGREPVNVGPGIVFVFPSDEEEQNFLVRRQRSAVPQVDRFVVPPGPSRGLPLKPAYYETHQVLLEQFWSIVVELGRFPNRSEFDRYQELVGAVGSVRRAYLALPFPEKDEELRRAALRRTDDLLVYMALNFFDKRSSFQTLPDAVQLDIRSFFGNYKSGLEKAKATLFDAGSREKVDLAIGEAAIRGLGVVDEEDGDYTFHKSTLDRQPVLLRIIFGCAERLEPIPESVALLKLHGVGDRASYLAFDDYDGKKLPKLSSRTIIDFRRQKVVEISGDTRDGFRVLLGKSAFMEEGTPDRETQVRFDISLKRKGILTKIGIGPGHRLLARRLEAAGLLRKKGNPQPEILKGMK